MTDVQKQAKLLVDFLGKEGALSHVRFVLSKQFGLEKLELRQFWTAVWSQIILNH